MNITGIWKVNKMEKKMLWEISGSSNLKKLSTVFVEAKSFDEAIKIAREINPDYCSGRVVCSSFSLHNVLTNE